MALKHTDHHSVAPHPGWFFSLGKMDFGGKVPPVVYTAVIVFLVSLLLGGILGLASLIYLVALGGLCHLNLQILAIKPVQKGVKFGVWLSAGVLCALIGWGAWLATQNIPVAQMGLSVFVWPLLTLPLLLLLGAVRAFRVQLKHLNKNGVCLHDPKILYKLATLQQIFLNRTGVVTDENLTVQVVIMSDGKPVLLKGLDFDASKRASMWRLAAAVTLCNQAQGEGVALGKDGVDMAFVRFSRRMGLSQKALLSHFPLVNFMPFDPEKRFEASFHKHGHKTLAAVKGAPEDVARLCGTPQAEWLQEVENLAHGGYRTIAVAGGEVASADGSGLEGNLTFLGLVALVDPLKEGAPQGIEACQKAKIKVSLLSGDHPATTLVSAKHLNIAARHAELVNSDALYVDDVLSENFANTVKNATVFSRLTPQQKQDVVAACAAQGSMTAVYGHTDFDDAAMAPAHLRIRPQHRGGQEKPADITLEKGAFELLPYAISRGRLALTNTRKTSRFVLGVFVAQVLFLVGLRIWESPYSLTSSALIGFNVFVLMLLTLAFAKEPPEQTGMQRPPQPASEPLMNKRLLRQAFVEGVLMAAAIFGLIYWQSQHGFLPELLLDHVALTFLSATTLVYLFFARNENRSFFKSVPWKNPLMWGMVFIVLSAQAGFIWLNLLRSLGRTLAEF